MVKIEEVNNGYILTKSNPLPQYNPDSNDIYVFRTADELGDFIKASYKLLFKVKES